MLLFPYLHQHFVSLTLTIVVFKLDTLLIIPAFVSRLTLTIVVFKLDTLLIIPAFVSPFNFNNSCI